MKNIYIAFVTILLFNNCSKKEPETPPTVKTLGATNITLTKATIGGEVISEGFLAATERGMVFSETNPKPSVSDTKLLSGYGIGSFSKDLENLKVNTKYYYSAFASNAKGTSYGEILNFTTADYKLATIVFETSKNIAYTTVQLTSTITEDGGVAVSERGFVLSTSPNPTVTNTKIQNGLGVGTFSTVVTQLKDETTYYAKAYAINGKGTVYSNEISFTTLGYKLPTVETVSAVSIGTQNATLNGNISNSGGADLIEKGFVFGTNPNVSLSDQKAISSTKESGNYSIVLTNLKPNTKYYYKAYAINAKGSALGLENSFSTLSAFVPNVSTNDLENISETFVRAGLEISGDGGSPITEYGVCISSANSIPTILDRKVVFGFAAKIPLSEINQITGLAHSTNYYLRGYAINSIGISYGIVKKFTTKTPFSAQLKNGLVAYYPFNGNANDESGNGNNGVKFNVINSNNRFGTPNSSFYFSSVDCSPRIEATVNTSFITTALTISIWVKKVGNGCYAPRILDFATSPINGPGQLQWGFGYNNTWGLDHAIGNFTNNFGVYPIGPDVWTHLVYTNDGTTCKFYQNGQLINWTSVNGLPILARNLTIGRMNHPAYDAFNGNLDDIGVWNRGLTAEEIKFLYDNDFKP